jgi:hypothetical protein
MMKTLWGDRHALRELPTLATSTLLDEIKALDFDKLEELADTDPLENWTTGGWAETDPNSKLTVSANEIAFAAVARGSGCHVGKDFGSGHFGSFIHKIDFNITAYTNSYDSQITVYDLFNDDTHWIDIFVQYSSSTVYNPQLLSMDPNYVSDYGNANKGTRYYGKLERNATNITFKYYTGSDYETGLVDTLAVSKGNSTPLSSIWNAGDSSGSGGSITGSLYNLDLQEVSVTEKTSSDTGSGADTKVSYPSVVHSRAETGSGADAKLTGEPKATLLGTGESGAGVDAKLSFLAALLKSDTGSGLDLATQLLAILTGSESGVGIDSKLSRDLALFETGIGADSSSLSTGTNKISSDLGAGIDAVISLLAAISRTDIGSGLDTITALLASFIRSDTGSGVDALKSLLKAFVSSDYGIGTESLGSRIFTAQDSGVGSESYVLSGAPLFVDSSRLDIMPRRYGQVIFRDKEDTTKIIDKSVDVRFINSPIRERFSNRR